MQEIEQIIEAKVDSKKEILATKENISMLKEGLLRFQVDVEKRFNSIILSVVSTGIATVGLIFTIIKLFIIK